VTIPAAKATVPTPPERAALDPSALIASAVAERIHVLHGRPLRKGAVLAHTAQFTEDRWDLTPAVLHQHGHSYLLDFTALPEPYRQLGKHLAACLLSGPHPPALRVPSISTIRHHHTALRDFFGWLTHRRADPLRLAELRPDDLADYHRHLLAALRTRSRRANYRCTIRLLWFYRHQLPDGLVFDPAHLDAWGEPHGPASGENATARIPEAVMGPILVWALRFVDVFAPDILAAADEALALQNNQRTGHPKPFKPERLTALLDGYHQRRQPLPGRRGAVNVNFLAHKIDCHRTTLQRGTGAALLAAAADQLGVDADTWLETTPTGHLDGRAWLDRVRFAANGFDSLGTLVRMLQAACYILVAYLSGMRDSEIKHLRRGCLTIRRDSAASPYRWTVTSLAFKGETDPRGATASWNVGQPAARAIAVLEQLQPADQPLLFTRQPYREGLRPSATNTAISTGATQKALADFATWINDYCQQHGRADRVPDVQGQPWVLITRQFRRTLAWFIARYPGGAIAGAIQYRHLSIQMFEGYAGTSDSGFRAEVDSEHAIARGEHLLDIFDEHQHQDLTGPAAAQAHQRLTDFSHHPDLAGHVSEQLAGPLQGKVVTDPRRLARLMSRHDPAIYPGKYVTCVFDHTKALCGTRPDLDNCQPLHCRNVALTEANRAALRDELAALDAVLGRVPAPPPYLAAILHQRAEAITAFLDKTDQPR
jgi:integrase